MSYVKVFGNQSKQIESFLKQGFEQYICNYTDATALTRDFGTNHLEKGLKYRYQYIVWYGKQSKPIARYACSSIQKMHEQIEDFFLRRKKHNDKKEEYKNESKTIKANDHYTVGDVIVYSWGYDQTNVDFFQVVEVLNSSIKIREIAQNNSDRGGSMGGKCMPRRNEFIGDIQIKRVKRNGYVSMPCGCGSKWDGRQCYTSSYY